MNRQYFFLAIILFLTSVSQVNAARFYRHIPFSLLAKENDSIIVEYDFSEKTGIYCISDQVSIIDFVYKGHPKSAKLPIKLESDHVPNKIGEALADVTGQFSIHLSQFKPEENIKVHCHYSNG